MISYIASLNIQTLISLSRLFSNVLELGIIINVIPVHKGNVTKLDVFVNDCGNYFRFQMQMATTVKGKITRYLEFLSVLINFRD